MVLRSSCARSLLSCSVDLTSVVWPLLVTAVITSPARTSARRLLRTSSTITPPPSFRSRFCSAVRSTTAKPRRLAACSCGFPRRSLRLATRSSGNSPTVTVISRVAPLRHSSTGALIPGLVLPTMRGNSLELDTGLPSNLRMMSPVSTHAFAAHVEQGPPGIPRVDRHVGLNEGNEVLLRQAAALGADNARGDGAVETEGRTDCDDPLADLEPVRIAHPYRRQPGRIDLDQGEIGAPVGADDASLEFALVGQANGDLISGIDDVRVGENVAVGTDDEARPERAALEIARA